MLGTVRRTRACVGGVESLEVVVGTGVDIAAIGEKKRKIEKTN